LNEKTKINLRDHTAIPAVLHENNKKDYHRAHRDHREKFKIILCGL
jgi:hypothetical protein